MFVSNIIRIEDVLIREEVIETEFTCDLDKCRGACCTFESDYGAPLLDDEIPLIEEYLPVIKNYLPQHHINEIEKNGFYVKKDNEPMTNSINNKACVFVYYENDIAKCGIEKAYIDGKINFKKPISCHLFPIRISDFGGDVLRFEKFKECSPALKKGEEDGIKLIDFCNDSLQRLYGKNWYKKLKESAEKQC